MRNAELKRIGKVECGIDKELGSRNADFGFKEKKKVNHGMTRKVTRRRHDRA